MTWISPNIVGAARCARIVNVPVIPHNQPPESGDMGADGRESDDNKIYNDESNAAPVTAAPNIGETEA
jgi:hypothetical protein